MWKIIQQQTQLWQRRIWPVEAVISFGKSTPQVKIPDMEVGVDNSIHVQTQNWSRSVKTKNLFWCFYLSMGVGSRVADNKEYLHKKTRKPQFFLFKRNIFELL